MDKYEHLLKVYQTDIESEELIRSKILTEENGLFFYVPSFGNRNIVEGLYAMYVQKNFRKARQHFYHAARIGEYMSVKFDRRTIDSGTFPVSYALLSDNEALIERYAVLKNSINDTTNIGYQLPNAVQNILLGQWDKLDINIRNLERFVKFPQFKWWAASVEVFKGFRAADKAALETGLQQMIQTHAKRNTEQLIPKFFSIDTAGYCKLAWRMGYEIDLKNDLVPIELMPIQPLPHYEEYDFLRDGE